MSYHDWHVGMKVVCVDASMRNYNPPNYGTTIHDLNGLEEGRVYTVRDICDFDGVIAVRLKEIFRLPTSLGREAPYAAARFRPVQKRKTDISIFKAMLHDDRVKEPS